MGIVAIQPASTTCISDSATNVSRWMRNAVASADALSTRENRPRRMQRSSAAHLLWLVEARENIGDPLPPDAKITELLRQLNDLIAEAQHPARD